MSSFDNVQVVKKANVYFDGKVTSRTVVFADGTKKTLGILLPGEYEFGTDTEEVMEIQSGELKVLLPGETEWINIKEVGVFTVPANTKFKLEVLTVSDYICSYN
ncbi:pyrimidine/purine nucleoside phosphorylase [Paenibacillus eucommiae]|uniref:Pyrimidine/purine nucleoside phosphorylase n=1 Tax=Paenibacillus eucommiae TaxID=1355755 RepID=A0ABS4J287_9BACL|nr:pyrimidine/purine nucleoside phosphorylase [Paenibacillus eucommiae]MBP1993898.1 uncharacterized protein YaiE (UPF0345 family) [Paenibacillus eucommiae]